jgi:hypothetical protein
LYFSEAGTAIRPTRSNVLDDDTVDIVTYLGGQRYFPLLPISNPAILGNQTEMIDNLLSTYDERVGYSISIDQLLNFLDFRFASPESRGGWKDDLIKEAISSLRNMPAYGEQAALVIVTRDSDRKKDASRQYRGIGSVLPGGFDAPRYNVRGDCPALFLTRFNGERDCLPDGTNKGWDNFAFWVPVIQFPEGNYAFSVNQS